MSAVYIRTVKTCDIELKQHLSEVGQYRGITFRPESTSNNSVISEKVNFSGQKVKGDSCIRVDSNNRNDHEDSENRYNKKEEVENEERKRQSLEGFDNEDPTEQNIFQHGNQAKNLLGTEDHHRKNGNIGSSDNEATIIQNKYGSQALGKEYLHSKGTNMEIGQIEHPGKIEGIQIPKDNNDSGIDTPDDDIGLITFRKMLDEFRKTLREEFATENIDNSEGISHGVRPIKTMSTREPLEDQNGYQELTSDHLESIDNKENESNENVSSGARHINTDEKIKEQNECKELTTGKLEPIDNDDKEVSSEVPDKDHLCEKLCDAHCDTKNISMNHTPVSYERNSTKNVQGFNKQYTFVKDASGDKKLPAGSNDDIETTKNEKCPTLNHENVKHESETLPFSYEENITETPNAKWISSNINIREAQNSLEEGLLLCTQTDDNTQVQKLIKEDQPQQNVCRGTAKNHVPSTILKDQQIFIPSANETIDPMSLYKDPQKENDPLLSGVSGVLHVNEASPSLTSDSEENFVKETDESSAVDSKNPQGVSQKETSKTNDTETKEILCVPSTEADSPLAHSTPRERPLPETENVKNQDGSETKTVPTLNNETTRYADQKEDLTKTEDEKNKQNLLEDTHDSHSNNKEDKKTDETFEKIDLLLRKVLDDDVDFSCDDTQNVKNEIIVDHEEGDDETKRKEDKKKNSVPIIEQVVKVDTTYVEDSIPNTDKELAEINSSIEEEEVSLENKHKENSEKEESSQADAQARAEQRKNSNVQMQFGTNGLQINSNIPADPNQPQPQQQISPYDPQQQMLQPQQLPYDQQQQPFQQTATAFDQQRELELYQQQHFQPTHLQQQLPNQQQQQQQHLNPNQLQHQPLQNQQQTYYQQQDLQMPPQQPFYGQQVGPYDGGGNPVAQYATNPYSNTYPSTTVYPSSLPEYKETHIPAPTVPHQGDPNTYNNSTAQPASTLQTFNPGQQEDPSGDPYGPNHPNRRRKEGRDHTNYTLPPNLDPFKTSTGPPGLPVSESGDYGDDEHGIKLVVLDKTDDEDDGGLHHGKGNYNYLSRPSTDVYPVDKEAVDRDLYKQEYIPQVNSDNINNNNIAQNGSSVINHNPPVPMTNAFGINNTQNVNQESFDTPKDPNPTFAFNVTDYDSETGVDTGRNSLRSQPPRQQQQQLQLYNPNQHYPFFDTDQTNEASTNQQIALQQGHAPSSTQAFHHPSNNGAPQQLYSMSLVDYERFTSNPSQLSTVREDIDDMETYRSEPIPQPYQVYQGVDNRTFLIHPTAMESNHHVMNGAHRPEFKIQAPGYKFQVNKENVVKRATRANILSRAEQLLDARRGQLTDRSDSSDELRRVNDGDDEDDDKFYDMTGPRHQALKHLHRKVYDDTTSYNSSDDVLNIMKLNPRGPVTQAARRARLTSVNARLNKQKRIRAARRQSLSLAELHENLQWSRDLEIGS